MLTQREIMIIRVALSYMRSNIDDVNKASDNDFTADEVFELNSKMGLPT